MAREPLVELPLERFLPGPADPFAARPSSSKRGAQKRPLSPGLAGPILSPAKRRLLAQTGLLCSPRSRNPLMTFAAQSHAPDATFSDLAASGEKFALAPAPMFAGEENIALDEAWMGATPPTTPRQLRTSPRLAAHQPPASVQPTTARRTPRASNNKAVSPPGSREGSPLPAMVARPRAPTPDRTSEHYPGFDIHWDTHIILGRARSPGASSKPPSSRSEADKENVRPRRGRKGGENADRPKKTAGVKDASFSPRRSSRLSPGKSSDSVAMVLGD